MVRFTQRCPASLCGAHHLAVMCLQLCSAERSIPCSLPIG
nr:MAG TPA: hypothetical protein [Caudoviricetes sp.]